MKKFKRYVVSAGWTLFVLTISTARSFADDKGHGGGTETCDRREFGAAFRPLPAQQIENEPTVDGSGGTLVAFQLHELF